MVLIDQDGGGPGGSDQMAMLSLLQAPQVEVLGITMVTGDAWRDEETLHTLRMLELTGHANIPVARGAVFPLVNSKARLTAWEAAYGKIPWKGAFNDPDYPPGGWHPSGRRRAPAPAWPAAAR